MGTSTRSRPRAVRSGVPPDTSDSGHRTLPSQPSRHACRGGTGRHVHLSPDSAESRAHLAPLSRSHHLGDPGSQLCLVSQLTVHTSHYRTGAGWGGRCCSGLEATTRCGFHTRNAPDPSPTKAPSVCHLEMPTPARGMGEKGSPFFLLLSK